MPRHHTDPIKNSWLELLRAEANARNVDINFPPQLWDFNLDEGNFIAGKIHTAERGNYNSDNENRIWFGSKDEVNYKNRLDNGRTISVILDIYSDNKGFNTGTDRFIFVDSELRSRLPSKDEKPTIYIGKNSRTYYYYHPTGSKNKIEMSFNDWDVLFDMVESDNL